VPPPRLTYRIRPPGHSADSPRGDARLTRETSPAGDLPKVTGDPSGAPTVEPWLRIVRYRNRTPTCSRPSQPGRAFPRGVWRASGTRRRNLGRHAEMPEDPIDHRPFFDDRDEAQTASAPGGVSHILSHLKSGSIKERVPRRVTRWRHTNSPGRSSSDAHANSLDLAGLESLQNSLLADPERVRGALERKPSVGSIDLGESVAVSGRHADSPGRAGHPRPCLASADQHLPQCHPPRSARIDAEPRSIPPGLQSACKHRLPRPPACSQTGSRPRREVLAALIVRVGGVSGTTFGTGSFVRPDSRLFPIVRHSVASRHPCPGNCGWQISRRVAPDWTIQQWLIRAVPVKSRAGFEPATFGYEPRELGRPSGPQRSLCR
jgi:hypothetical protein